MEQYVSRFSQVYYKVGATREPTLQIITDLKGIT